MNFFPLNIQVLRKSKGLKQSDMEQIGFKRTTWNNYESGASQPNIDGILSIAKYFDISIDDLLNKDLSQNSKLMKSVEFIKKPVKLEERTEKNSGAGLNESSSPYIALPRDQTEEDTIEALKEVIEVQKQLIDSLNKNVELLNDLLNKKKKAPIKD